MIFIFLCPAYYDNLLVHLCAKLLQSCLIFCDPLDCSQQGSSVNGILQVRILEWVAIFSSRGIFPTQGSNPSLLGCLHWQTRFLPLAPPGGTSGALVVWSLGRVTPWTVDLPAPLSLGFSRREYWSGLPFPSPGHLPDPEIEPASPVSPASLANSLPTELSAICSMLTQ